MNNRLIATKVTSVRDTELGVSVDLQSGDSGTSTGPDKMKGSRGPEGGKGGVASGGPSGTKPGKRS